MNDNIYIIRLEDVRIFARHGVLPEERLTGNEFIVDLTVKTIAESEVLDDDISATVSYADLYVIIREEMRVPRNLLESVAGGICTRIKNKYPQILEISVKITKCRPPIPDFIGKASIEFNWRR